MRPSELARASGLDDGYLSRVLRGTASPSVDRWARIAVPLGLDLPMRLYQNTGPRVRDRFAAPMLEAILRDAHPRWARDIEVGVHQPARGWIDLGLHDPVAPVFVAGELQSELRRLEQLVRWQEEKAESVPSWEGWTHLGSPPVSRLLVVRRTRATREVAAAFARQLRTAYPAHPDDALAALAGTGPVAGRGACLDGSRAREGPRRVRALTVRGRALTLRGRVLTRGRRNAGGILGGPAGHGRRRRHAPFRGSRERTQHARPATRHARHARGPWPPFDPHPDRARPPASAVACRVTSGGRSSTAS
ncbi:MAG TPA: helix-turn-helix transcriptional regulator [Candidatus Limnocylindrales bacterium]|nr:helix-turn-helix transcriptional regulator [Candidatus Limnocylindrales bacterium]